MNSLISMIVRNRRYLAGSLAVLLFLCAAVNVFTFLGKSRIRSWDEARHGVSACEMMDTGNYIVNTYNYEPDYWNAKPLLSFYNDLLGMKIFGRNIFGFRFFSAVCYLLIGAMMFYLLWHEAGAPAALVGAAAFFVSPTNWSHSFRTGDPDATFMMFCFAAFVFLCLSVKKGRLLPFAAFFLGLAFLTKSFHVGVPGILAVIFVIANWKRYTWLDFVLTAAAGAAPVLIWAAVRASADGWSFFQSMIDLDLLGRVSEDFSKEHSPRPWYFYFLSLNHYLVVIPLAETVAFLVLFCCFKGPRRFFASSGALWKWAAFYFLFMFVAFSCCFVKLDWYIFPSLLYGAVVFGVLFQLACNWLREEAEATEHGRNMLFMLPPALIITAALVWIGIGEGKAIRNLVLLEPQCDVLTIDGNGESYRGGVFYCVDEKGEPELPRQKHLLVIRFLDGKVVLDDVDTYRDSTSSDGAYLICSFEEDVEEYELPALAEQFAAEHSLQLIRCVNGLGLYRR